MMTSSTQALTEQPRRATGASGPAAAAALLSRGVTIYRRTPELLFLGVIQGVIFLLIFRYAFGGALHAEGMEYVDFLVPGIVTVGVLFAGGFSAVGIATDTSTGFYDRLRAMPISSGAILFGRATADTLLVAWTLAICAIVSFLVGFRVHTSAALGLAAFALIIYFGFAFVWIFIALGLLASGGNAQTAQGLGFLVLPISFASSAYVMTNTMPGWLQPIAENQPVSLVVNAARCLTQGAPAEAALGHSTEYFVTAALIWTTALFVIFMALAVVKFGKR